MKTIAFAAMLTAALLSSFPLVAFADGESSRPAEASLAPPAKEQQKMPNLSGLTTDEIRTYQYGEISTGSLIGGGLLGTVVGLGTGHIVYGEYGRKGWIFTLGELGSYGIMLAGSTTFITGCLSGNSSNCGNGAGLIVAGALAYVGFRVWEIIDVWTLPGSHNADYRAIKAKVEGGSTGDERQPRFMLLPIVAQGPDSSVNAGLELGYRF